MCHYLVVMGKTLTSTEKYLNQFLPIWSSIYVYIKWIEPKQTQVWCEAYVKKDLN